MTVTNPRAQRMRRGFHLQVYLDAIPGHGLAWMTLFTRQVAVWAGVGGCGVVLHDPGGVDRTRQLAAVVLGHGLQCSVAHGLGQNASHEPDRAADAAARIAVLSEITANLFDLEGKWRDEKSDKRAAGRLVVGLRKRVPDALLVLQAVPVLQTESASFDNFGRDELLAGSNAAGDPYMGEHAVGVRYEGVDATCPMAYRAYGSSPYRYDIFPTWRAKYASLGRDRGITQTWESWETVQAYRNGEGGTHGKFVNVMITEPSGVTVAWAEPHAGIQSPDADFMLCMREIQALGRLGHRGATAVRAFQAAHGLKVDGLLGPITAERLRSACLAAHVPPP
ncbi:MAG: peptidoglycan-binding domain-containing protein [Ilumatobacteraceae bacterium]